MEKNSNKEQNARKGEVTTRFRTVYCHTETVSTEIQTLEQDAILGVEQRKYCEKLICSHVISTKHAYFCQHSKSFS